MENASNALIIAGGILIGLLIISLAVYIFIDFGSTSAKINKQNEEQQLIQFNSKFTVYEGKKDLTIHDIVTVAGYAKENNKYYGDDDNDTYYVDNYKIKVTITSSRGITDELEKKDLSTYNKQIKDELGIDNKEIPTYSCSITYHDNGRVAAITFKQNSKN